MIVEAHTICSLLSYAAFLAAFVSGILFLILDAQIKRKHMGVLFHRLPSLHLLDRINFLSLGFGVALLSVGVSLGLISAHGLGWIWGPKGLLIALLWGVYAGLWIVRLRSTVRGRRIALLSIGGFSVAVLTFVGIWHFPWRFVS